MPERIFKYFFDTPDLIAAVKDLGMNLASGAGSTNVQKNSHTGFLIETGPVTQTQLRQYFMNGRWEIWLRGQGVDGMPADQTCLDLEQTNPYLEKKMVVRSIYNPSEGWAFPPANINCP